MTYQGNDREESAFTCKYRAPLVSAILLLSGLALFLYADERHFREAEMMREKDFAQGFRQALEVYIGQFKGFDAARLSGAFDLLVASSRPLRFMLLTRRGQRVAASKSAPASFIPEGEQGACRLESHFVIWWPFDLEVPEGSPLGRSSHNILVVGVDHRHHDARLSRRTHRLLSRFCPTMAAIVAAMLVWGLTIRNRDLAERLSREQAEHLHLDRLGLAAAGLAHETKNPLGIILGHAQRLARAPEATDEVRDAAIQMVDAAESASARLGEFIEYARIRDVDPEPVEATELIERTTMALAMDFEAEGVELRKQVAPLVLRCDAERTTQVLINLLLNSLHASQRGSHVTITLKRDGATAVLTVSDQGCGIPAELVPDVFEPYVSGTAGGHGLGLAITKMVIDRHGWTVDLSSEEGKGTTVTIGGLRVVDGKEV